MSDEVHGLPAAGSRPSGEGQKRIPTTGTGLPAAREPNWPLLYGAVLAGLVMLIALFYLFTKAFA